MTAMTTAMATPTLSWASARPDRADVVSSDPTPVTSAPRGFLTGSWRPGEFQYCESVPDSLGTWRSSVTTGNTPCPGSTTARSIRARGMK